MTGAIRMLMADGRTVELGDQLQIELGASIWFGAAVRLEVVAGGLKLVGDIPAADPEDAGQLWVDPLTRALKVSAGGPGGGLP